MLIPQFSLRWLLGVVTACSLVFLVMSFGARGYPWGIGATIGLLSLVVVVLVHGFTFFLVWLFATFTAQRKVNRAKKTVVGLVSLLAASQVYAGGMVNTVPPNGKPAPNGILLTLDTTWPEGFGYRPVTITARCLPPLNSDRTLSFELCYPNWRNNQTHLRATCELDVPAGASSVSTTIAVPDFSLRQTYTIDTWEDGRHISELSEKGLGANLGFGGTNNSMPAVLCIAGAQPNVNQLPMIFPQPQYRYGGATPATPTPPPFPPEWAWRMPSALPEEWLCYQNLDVIIVSLVDLTGLQTSSPKVFAAIRDWTRAGGNLFVLDLGDGFSRLPELDRLFDLATSRDATDDASANWQDPQAALFNAPFSEFEPQYDQNGNPVVQTSTASPPAKAPFRWREVQQGTIVAIEGADPFAAFDQETWRWVFQSITTARWLGAKRLGFSFAEENSDFWTFLIPGVGVAPVDAYRVLITAFVVLIGPVNYLLLRKHGRLHLLLFTVPASALVVTAALLGYALIADGLGTRVRSRSVTLLDQRTRQAVSWARLAYYSGLAPSGGLRFSRDTAVIPFEHMPTGTGASYVSRTLDIEPDHQQLSRGWLPSRTPTQLITVKPYSSSKSIKISTDANKALLAENQLGMSIRHLLVRSEDGRWGYGSEIAKDATTSLHTTAEGEKMIDGVSKQKMLRAFTDQALALPPGFADESLSGIFGIHRRNMYRMYNSGPTTITQAEGRLEGSLTSAHRAVLNTLMPRSYIAIVERPEEISIGMDGVTETEGALHVIRGNW